MTFSGGCVHFHVPGEFKVSLSLLPNEDTNAWRLMDLTFLAKSDTTKYEGTATFNTPQISAIITEHQSRLDASIGDSALLDLYSSLHHIHLQYLLRHLLAQSSYLAQTTWTNLLYVKKTEGVELHFWRIAGTNDSTCFLRLLCPERREVVDVGKLEYSVEAIGETGGDGLIVSLQQHTGEAHDRLFVI